MKYPREAVDNGIQGRVQVEFIIDENGKVGDVKVVRGADPLLDAEAVRVVSASPKWKPGKVGGRSVKAEMSLYIEFKLQKGRTFGIKK
jgi:TonB family protein